MALPLRGDQGSFSYTSGNANVSSLDIDFWEQVQDRPMSQYRPFGWAAPRAVVGGANARVRFRCYQIDAATAPSVGDQPATSGTLVLGVKSTTQKYQFKAVVFRMTSSANSSDGTPQPVIYEAVISPDSSTDTITVA